MCLNLKLNVFSFFPVLCYLRNYFNFALLNTQFFFVFCFLLEQVAHGRLPQSEGGRSCGVHLQEVVQRPGISARYRTWGHPLCGQWAKTQGQKTPEKTIKGRQVSMTHWAPSPELKHSVLLLLLLLLWGGFSKRVAFTATCLVCVSEVNKKKKKQVNTERILLMSQIRLSSHAGKIQ